MTRPTTTRPTASPTAPKHAEPACRADPAESAAHGEPGDRERPAQRHGTLATYRHDRCRCGACRAANRDAQRRRRRAIAYGRWQPFVDREAARAHVDQLVAAGLSLRRIAELSGLSRGCVEALVHGTRARGPSHQIRASTAAHILSVTPPFGSAADHPAHVDATDARRRLRELIALGWSMSRIAERLQCTHSHVSRLLNRRTISSATDLQIRDLHHHLSVRRPDDDTPPERASVDAARRYAARRGWLPPHSATTIRSPDEDALLDMVAVQRAVDGRAVALNPAERRAAAAQLTAQGTSARQIAEQLGTHPRTVQRYRRTSQPDPPR